MTQPPPITPPQQPYELAYQSLPPNNNARLLVRLAAIFNLIAAGFDALHGLGLAVMVVLMLVVLLSPSAYIVTTAPGTAPPTKPPFLDLIAATAMYGVPAILSLGSGVVKFMGGMSLLRLNRNAW